MLLTRHLQADARSRQVREEAVQGTQGKVHVQAVTQGICVQSGLCLHALQNLQWRRHRHIHWAWRTADQLALATCVARLEQRLSSRDTGCTGVLHWQQQPRLLPEGSCNHLHNCA